MVGSSELVLEPEPPVFSGSTTLPPVARFLVFFLPFFCLLAKKPLIVQIQINITGLVRSTKKPYLIFAVEPPPPPQTLFGGCFIPIQSTVNPFKMLITAAVVLP